MNQLQIAPDVIPRLPVLGWASFSGDRTTLPRGILEAPQLRFTTSGRAAIALALRQLGIRPGDGVLVPTYHCPTMIAPAVHIGATPIFCPITESGAVSLEYLQRQDLSKVKVLLAAHYFGLPQPMAQLRKFCDEKGIALIEDCAHAIFGESDGKPVGGWGDFAIASLTKFFPVSEGGCLVSNRSDADVLRLSARGTMEEFRALLDIMEIGSRYARMGGLNQVLGGVFALKNRLRNNPRLPGPSMITLDVSDLADPASEFDSSLVSADLTSISRWVVKAAKRSRVAVMRRRNYETLASQLRTLPGARVLQPQLTPSAVPYVFPLWVDDADRNYYALKAEGVPVFRWDRLWPSTPVLAGDHGMQWSRNIFQLPCHQDLSPLDMEWLIGKLYELFRRSARTAA